MWAEGRMLGDGCQTLEAFFLEDQCCRRQEVWAGDPAEILALQPQIRYILLFKLLTYQVDDLWGQAVQIGFWVAYVKVMIR